MDKVAVFKSLLDKFETEEIRLYCEDMIKEIPDYIFTIPSSTSYKYHNKTQCQEHGQIFHILMFGEIMNYVLGLDYMKSRYPTAQQRDCMRCTPIFHDAIKCGLNGSKFTVFEHPMLASKWIKETKVEHDISDRLKEYIARLCESHSGQWNTSNKSELVMPVPEKDDQFFVHMCDYLSSRSNIDMIYSDEVISSLTGIPVPVKEININEYTLPFGKHKGEKLIDVKSSDPGWYKWANENMENPEVRAAITLLENSK